MNHKEDYFTDIFLKSRTNLELCIIQHELRWFPEDKEKLNQVLEELKQRVKNGYNTST